MKKIDYCGSLFLETFEHGGRAFYLHEDSVGTYRMFVSLSDFLKWQDNPEKNGHAIYKRFQSRVAALRHLSALQTTTEEN